MPLKRAIIFWAMVGLAGCGAKGALSPDARSAQAASLYAELAISNRTDPTQLPFQGQAEYAGFSTLNLPIGDMSQSFTGDLTITVQFAPDATVLTGQIASFDGATGSLTFENGQIIRDADPDDDYALVGDLNGDLGIDAVSYTLDGTVAADFLGRYYDGLLGVVFGLFTGPDGVDIFDGAIGAVTVD